MLIGRRECEKLLRDTQPHLLYVIARYVLSQTRAALRWFVTLIVCPRKGAVLFEECVKSTQDIKPVEDTGQRKGVLSDQK